MREDADRRSGGGTESPKKRERDQESVCARASRCDLLEGNYRERMGERATRLGEGAGCCGMGDEHAVK